MNVLPRILCVDDDESVLHGLDLNLRNAFDVVTASDGLAGLEAIRQRGQFAVVLSDMSLPNMDGATFLRRVREESPATVRVLLTAQRDLAEAASTINEGQPFRVLVKPCTLHDVESALLAAVEQHRLDAPKTSVSKEIPYESIHALVDILVLANPLVFGRPNRLMRHVHVLAEKCALSNTWQIELAAILSQVGCLTVPPETVNKQYQALDLEQREMMMMNKLPEVTRHMLGGVPGLDPVLEILDCVQAPLENMPENSGKSVPIGARLLRIVSDFDTLETTGLSPQNALAAMQRWRGSYDPEILAAFSEYINQPEAAHEVEEMPIRKVSAGMILAEDLVLNTGVLFAPRGYLVSENFLARVMNLDTRDVWDPVRVILRPGRE